MKKMKYNLAVCATLLIAVAGYSNCLDSLNNTLDRVDEEYAGHKKYCKTISRTLGYGNGMLCGIEAEAALDQGYEDAINEYNRC